MKLPYHLLLLIGIAAFIAGCSVSRSIQLYKTQMAASNAIHQQNLKDINKADSIRNEKYINGRLDNVTSRQLEKYIDTLRRIALRHLNDDSVMLSKKLRHSNIEFYLMISNRIAQEAKAQEDNIDFINTLLATNTFTEFNMSSLFAPGQYVLTGSEKQRAVETFTPVIDSILSFTSQFPARKLAATIILLGFADAQPINPESELAATLLKKIGKSTAESAALNQELSRLRAGSARAILNEIIKTKKTAKPMYAFLSVDYIFQGRGEELPNEKIKDYRSDDERRRVVKVFWSIIPWL
jgi:hypothetical protein